MCCSGHWQPIIGAVRCREVRCGALCCSVLQRVAVPICSLSSMRCISQNVAICCGVLQRVAVCCSVLQYVAVIAAVCCSVLQYVAVFVAVCCSVLQYVAVVAAVCCSVLQCVAVCCSYHWQLIGGACTCVCCVYVNVGVSLLLVCLYVGCM